jgi:hypothetical protein
MKRRRSMDGRGLVLASVLVTLGVLGEAGHLLLDQLNAVVAHHFFHLLFPLVAFAIFGLFVARDVRKHGWPRFAWALSAHYPPTSNASVGRTERSINSRSSAG